MRKSIAVDLALLERYDTLLTELERYLVRQAKQHDPQAFQLLRSVPGIGKVLALTILYEIHDIHRFDRVQEFASYARLVKCAKESAGKKLRHERRQDGQRPPEVGLLGGRGALRAPQPEGKKLLARLEKRVGKGKAPVDSRPQARADGLLHAAARQGVRSRRASSRP